MFAIEEIRAGWFCFSLIHAEWTFHAACTAVWAEDMPSFPVNAVCQLLKGECERRVCCLNAESEAYRMTLSKKPLTHSNVFAGVTAYPPGPPDQRKMELRILVERLLDEPFDLLNISKTALSHARSGELCFDSAADASVFARDILREFSLLDHEIYEREWRHPYPDAEVEQLKKLLLSGKA